MVDGRGAHCTLLMPTSLRMKRGVPPPTGTAKIEERVLGPADLGVETYRISEPSGVSLGSESCSALLTTLSGNGWPIVCLKISRVPFRSELNKTALLSGVQAKGTFSFSSRVSLRWASRCVLSAAKV